MTMHAQELYTHCRFHR